MHIHLRCIGKLKEPGFQALAHLYTQRLTWTLTVQEGDVKNSAALPPDRRMTEEATFFTRQLPEQACLIVLDERGKNLTSPAFANLLAECQILNTPPVFLIGGADGLAPVLREQARHLLALGQMTWPHQLARIMLLEQIYRAQQILKGHPYHRG